MVDTKYWNRSPFERIVTSEAQLANAFFVDRTFCIHRLRAARAPSLQELKSELNSIKKDSGRTLDVRLREQAGPTETFDDVVLVKLKGTCKMERMIPLMDERGPLAFTRIAKAVSGAIWGGARKQADKLLGRALGRVLAHELYHILGKTHEHNADGSVAKEALSAKQLISDTRITFHVRDLNRMTP